MTFVSLLHRDDIPEDVKEVIRLAIADQRKTEEAYLKTKTRLEFLLKSSPAVIFSCEPGGNFSTSFMSENVKDITGYDEGEFINDPSFWTNGIHPDDRQRLVDTFEGIVQSEHYSETYRFKHKNGSYLWMMDEASLIRDKQGNPIEIVGYWTDITKQKEAEEKLRKSEEEYRSLFENIPIGLYRSTPDHKYLATNPTFVKQVGLSSFEELISLDPDQLANRLNYDRNRFLDEINIKGEVRGLESELKQSDGTSIFIRENARAIRDSNGTILCYEGSVEDITDRVLAEEALRESEKRFRTLFDESPISLWEEDGSRIKQYIENLRLRGIEDFRQYFDTHPEEVIKVSNLVKVLDVNNATLMMYKAHQKEDLLKNISVVFGEDSFLAFKEMIIALADGRRVFEIDSINKTLTGEEIQVLLRLTVVPGFESSLSRVIISILDITDRVEMEKALRESEERLRAFMDSATDSFLLLDSDLNIIEANQNMATGWKFNKHELIGRNIVDLRERAIFDSPVEYTERFTQLLDVIKTGSLYDEEFTILHPIHGKRYTSVRAFKVGTGLGIISRDITQQKEAELVRRELEQRRENFIYMASHELRTPLTVISGYCDFLDKHDQFIDHDRRDKIISVMKSNVHRLERLTEDVAQVAQIEKEQFQVSKKEFDLCNFLHENLDQYTQLLGNQFKFQKCNTKSIIINADPDRIQQVLENVISNAIKHTSKDKREIIVKVELQDNSVQIFITDNGAGIASEHLDSIFDQFTSFQTEYAAGGTGIGLYLSRKIIEAHGGTITAQSAGRGFGSTFIIKLPK
ncbi:MAG: PAS domain S-box protein [Promethearchaeota archaeon]